MHLPNPIPYHCGYQGERIVLQYSPIGTSTTRSIAENTASGENIGTAIAATDADNDTLTYTLGGTDAASFGIDATNGHLKTKTTPRLRN